MDGSRRVLDHLQTDLTRSVEIIEDQEATTSSLKDGIKNAEIVERQILRLKAGKSISDEDAASLLEVVRDILALGRTKSGQRGSLSTSYVSPHVEKLAGRGGQNKRDIDKDWLKHMIGMNHSASSIAKTQGVCTKTIHRHLKYHGIEPMRQKFIDISDRELDVLVGKEIGTNQKMGFKTIHSRLTRDDETLIQKHRVRMSVERVDPVGLALRSVTQTIERRKYVVAAPNSMWHIDGNHKLVKYGIVIHGCIDGYSRMSTFIRAAPDNKAKTVLDLFLNGTEEYGFPSRIRVDQGVENADIVVLMEIIRGKGSAIRGKSVHNTRIERNWKDLMKDCTNTFVRNFKDLEGGGALDKSSDLDIWLVHQIFLPILNEAMLTYMRTWNNHGLRTENYKTPRQIFSLGLYENYNSSLRAIRDIVDGNTPVLPPWGDEDHQHLQGLLGRTRVDVPNYVCPLSRQEEVELRASVDFLRESDSEGVDTYVDAREKAYEIMSRRNNFNYRLHSLEENHII